MKNFKPFRLERTSLRTIILELWEQEDGRIVALVHLSKDKKESMSFDTLSGARSWGYFQILKTQGVKRT